MTELHDNDELTIADIACPKCGELCPHAAGFCESCGASLTGTATGASTASPTPPEATSPTPDTGNCLACGGSVLADGFCDTCGNRALTRRDHWTESPATWIGGVCDKGIVHVRNEDAMALAGNTEPNSFAALVICDGVTSAPNSDQASLGAVRVACDRLVADSMTRSTSDTLSTARRVADWSDSLTKACALAQRATVEVAEALGNPTEPPSCTFATAIVDRDLLVVGWCGDSRVYWLPDLGPASALSRDHSLGTEMIDSGIDPAVAEADPTSHTITRWLGADSPTPSPDVVSMSLHEDGWVLVCSDGLWNYASGADALREHLRTAVADGATTPTAIAESLAAFANSCGGHDNISVALARITTPDQRKD